VVHKTRELTCCAPPPLVGCFSEAKSRRVTCLLEDLSLTGCADTRVGNVDHRGISGGQRKRVSIVSIARNTLKLVPICASA
jgi:ABC-type multidrug transport system ATPase subunit